MTKKSEVQRTKWSTPQLETHIRQEALHTERVIFLPHVQQRMRERRITKDMALETLKKGRIRIRPEMDYNTGDLKCRMEHYVAGADVKIVVAISDDDPNLIVVTAI